MKKQLLILGAILISLFGCDTIDDLTKFNIEYTETVTVPSSTAVDLPFNIFTPDIESNSESTFSSNNTNKGLIESIVLKEMNLTIKSPENGNFSFLKSIEIFISAEGLPEERIAWNEDIPEDIDKNIQLETSGTDIKAYIKKDEFKLRLNTTTDEILTSDYEIEIKSIFFVDANILGV